MARESVAARSHSIHRQIIKVYDGAHRYHIRYERCYRDYDQNRPRECVAFGKRDSHRFGGRAVPPRTEIHGVQARAFGRPTGFENREALAVSPARHSRMDARPNPAQLISPRREAVRHAEVDPEHRSGPALADRSMTTHGPHEVING